MILVPQFRNPDHELPDFVSVELLYECRHSFVPLSNATEVCTGIFKDIIMCYRIRKIENSWEPTFSIFAMTARTIEVEEGLSGSNRIRVIPIEWAYLA